MLIRKVVEKMRAEHPASSVGSMEESKSLMGDIGIEN